MSLCTECKNRSICNSLCPEAELYANQDNVSLKEYLLSIVDIESINQIIKYDPATQERNKFIEKFNNLSKLKQVETLLECGLSRNQIAQIVGIKRESLRKIIHKIKHKGDAF